MTGTLGEFDIALDYRFEYQLLEMTLYLVENLVGQTQTRVIHCQEETFNLQFRIQLLLDNLNGIQQF